LSLSVTFRGTPNALTRALRKCAMRGLSLPADRDKVQRVLDREAKRAETMRILNAKSGGIA
jgi:hypothetical protein